MKIIIRVSGKRENTFFLTTPLCLNTMRRDAPPDFPQASLARVKRDFALARGRLSVVRYGHI